MLDQGPALRFSLLVGISIHNARRVQRRLKLLKLCVLSSAAFHGSLQPTPLVLLLLLLLAAAAAAACCCYCCCLLLLLLLLLAAACCCCCTAAVFFCGAVWRYVCFYSTPKDGKVRPVTAVLPPDHPSNARNENTSNVPEGPRVPVM